MEYLNDELVSDLKDLFNELDYEHTGYLDSKAVGSILKSIGEVPTEEAVKDLISTISPQGEGKLNFSEFITLITKEYNSNNRSSEIDSVFKIIDKDNDGMLSRSDIHTTSKENNLGLSSEDVVDIVGTLGENELISPAQFKEALIYQ